MDSDQNINYYNSKTKHTYMYANNYDLLIGDFLNHYQLNQKNVLEIGSGFGRYTALLAEKCNRVIASEPNEFMFNELKSSAGHLSNVEVINKDIDGLLADFPYQVDFVFLFHVIHHLKKEELDSLCEFIKKNKINTIILEPNHLNLLFFFQILITKDMKFSEEKGMFVDNSKKLKKSIPDNEFQFKRNFIGLLPRGITNFLGRKMSFFKNSSLFSTKISNPFFSYSVFHISPK